MQCISIIQNENLELTIKVGTFLYLYISHFFQFVSILQFKLFKILNLILNLF